MKNHLIVLSLLALSCGKKDDNKADTPAEVIKNGCFRKGLTYDDAAQSCGKSANYGLISKDSDHIKCKGYTEITNYGAYCTVDESFILQKQDSEKQITIEYIYIAEPSLEQQSPKTDDPSELNKKPNIVLISDDNGVERSLELSDFDDNHKPISNTITFKGTGPIRIADLNLSTYKKGYWLEPDASLQIFKIDVK
jgi:hypothetical protein